jgi:hypothetical protein
VMLTCSRFRSDFSAAHNGTAMVMAATAASKNVRSRRRMKRSSLSPVTDAVSHEPNHRASAQTRLRHLVDASVRCVAQAVLQAMCHRRTPQTRHSFSVLFPVDGVCWSSGATWQS